MRCALALALWSLLAAPALAAGQTPTAAPAPAEEPRQAVLDLSLSPELGFRKFSYRDRVSTSLAGFSSGTMFLGRAAMMLFPFANQGLPIVSNVGVLGSVSRSLRGHTPDASGADFDTLWHQWELGGEWRAIFGGREWGALSIRYGSVRFDISGPPADPNTLLPTGTKQYWRPGIDLRFPFYRFALAISGGYLAVVVHDAVSAAFPRSTVAGVDAGARFEWAITQRLGLILSGAYTRFFYSLHPLPGDPYIAGGALDEYAVLDLALHARF